MFQRKTLNEVGFSVGQALRWLRFIAHQLNRRDETQFFIENLQPDWLPANHSYELRFSGVLVGGFIGGLIGCFVTMLGLFNSDLYGLYIFMANIVGLNLAIFISNALGGVLIGGFAGFFLSGGDDIEPVEEVRLNLSRSSSVVAFAIFVPLFFFVGLFQNILLTSLLRVLGGTFRAFSSTEIFFQE